MDAPWPSTTTCQNEINMRTLFAVSLATFLAAEAGPIEPNIYALFEDGAPERQPGSLNTAVEVAISLIAATASGALEAI